MQINKMLIILLFFLGCSTEIEKSVSIDEAKKDDCSGGNRKYVYAIVDSIKQDEAKTIQLEIKKLKFKVKAVNQGDEIRVTGKNIDDLQKIMKHLKEMEFKSPLVFDNFR